METEKETGSRNAPRAPPKIVHIIAIIIITIPHNARFVSLILSQPTERRKNQWMKLPVCRLGSAGHRFPTHVSGSGIHASSCNLPGKSDIIKKNVQHTVTLAGVTIGNFGKGGLDETSRTDGFPGRGAQAARQQQLWSSFAGFAGWAAVRGTGQSCLCTAG